MRAIVFALLLFATHAYADPVCVLPIGGQSNAVGAGGDAALSFAPAAGAAYVYSSGAITLLGQAKGFTPSFASAFVGATGIPILFVPVALGSTSQTAQFGNYAGNPHWDIGGTMVPAALATIASATAAAIGVGFQPRMCGMLWSQGEDEGVGFVTVPNIVDAADYLTAFPAMVGRFRAIYPAMPFYIIRTGAPTGGEAPYAAGFALVRDAQEQRAQADSRTPIVSRLASTFVARGMMADDAHWNQHALNEIGTDAAANVVASGLWK